MDTPKDEERKPAVRSCEWVDGTTLELELATQRLRLYFMEPG